jgi:hypothetical protein
MKKVLLILAVFTALLPSCRKESIDDIQKDLCKGIVCNNGGVCVNGQCECPPQWTGPSCSTEKAPLKMRVTSIRLLDFPPTDPNGGGWDIFDGPDVFLEIRKSTTVLHTTSFVPNLSGQHEWAVNFEFASPTETYSIFVWDDDGLLVPEFMGAINFTPYRPGEKFPSSFTLDCAACVVSFQMNGVLYFH